MKRTTKTRHLLLASLVAGSTIVSTGCSSGGFPLASMNPFAKSATTGAGPQPPGRLTESIASTATAATNQLSSIGSTAKNALGKTTGAVASVFKTNKDVDPVSATDPLSLSNRPKKIGPEVFVANGQLWESTGDFDKAMESYTKALESEPNHAPALTSIARLHFRQNRHTQAADYFRRAIEQSPEDAGLYNDLGLTLSKEGDYSGATKSLEQALELAPGTSRYANNLASVKFEAGETSSAYQVLSKNNKPAVAHFNMAYLHFKNGQLSEAKGHLTQAVRYEPQAAGDAAVQRAVERSRDMLAQINASAAPVAQAAPQATIAGGQYFGGTQPSPPVQQTSQSVASKPNVAPPAPISPAISAVAPVLPSVSLPTPVTAERPLPVKPAEPVAGSATGVTTDSPSASVPFSLPHGFATPESK